MSAPDRKKTRTVTEKRWGLYRGDSVLLLLDPEIARVDALNVKLPSERLVRVTLTYEVPDDRA
jgi:hypothetical protein